MGRNEMFAAIVLLLCIGASRCQENAMKNISPSLIECYDNELYGKHNLLAHTMDTFIAIIRKIEQSPMQNMPLRVLSTSILHRFRQDGIEMNPEVRPQAGVMPYAPLGKQFYRHAQTLRIVPGNAINFPNDSISALERCTLHSMLSSSFDIYKHPGETRGCKTSNYGYNNYGFRRWRRSAHGPKDDVETLSPEQLEMLMAKDQVDPNSKYPALPPNHPSASARITEDQLSECPIESGVIKTAWGPVSAGSLLAGIAAGVEPQTIRIGELIKQQVEPRVFNGLPTDANLDNKFLATLAGDLAEVALAQGPQSRARFTVGPDGAWNSTSRPLYYFLSAKDDLQMTAAEIRGDLDGLILANEVPNALSKFNGLRLSQVLDMYYSERGLFDPKLRACQRRVHLPKVAPTEMLTAQTRSAAIVLSSVGYATVTISPEKIDTFSAQAVKDFSDFIPSMNKDNNCEFSDSNYASSLTASRRSSLPAVDLSLIIDTNWPFESLQPVLAQILNALEINRWNSNFTIINGYDGSFIVNSSNSITEFADFNISRYSRLNKGFDMARSIDMLKDLQTYKLDEEKRRGLAGGKSDVVVFMPHHVNLSPSDRDFVFKSFDDMRKEVPDARVFFLTYGQKDVWGELVEDSDDVISINLSENMENNPAIDTIVTRIKQVPRRLVNTECGSNYDKSGNSRELMATVGVNGINFYRIQPNYFMRDDSDKAAVKVQGLSGSPLRVCWSRELLHVNSSAAQMAAACASITSNTHKIELDCEGVSYIHQCKPFYFSIESNSNSTSTPRIECTNPLECRYPDDIKFKFSFENLVCKSAASASLLTPLLLLATLARLFI